MKKLYSLQCLLKPIPAFLVFCSNAFGQCALTVDIGPFFTNVSCNGAANGDAFVSITNSGTLPYTYAWNTTPVQTTQTATGLSGGTGSCPNCGDTVYTVIVTDALGCVATDSVTITEGPVLTAAVDSIRDASCFGACDGKIYVSACGGTCPSSSSYLWDDPNGQISSTATGLCAGTYTVIITATGGSGCDTIYRSASVSEPTPLTATISGNPPCNSTTDGTATVNPSGGTIPYSYLWSANAGNQTTQTANNLPSNTYSVIITDANDCKDTLSVIVTPKITVSFSSTQDARCIGVCDGSARAVASGGTPAYNYSWSPPPGGGSPDSATGLCANTIYTVTVTDNNGCIDNISFPPAALIALTGSITGTDVNCGENNGTATADISGGDSPYAYSWSTGQTTANIAGLSRGTYTVTINDSNGCSVDTAVTINERCEIKPPNTFTPNGDGINDTWEIANLDLYPDCEVKIYNRWGDIVLNQVGYDTDSEWGEGSSGETVSTLPSAVYYYVIDLKDEEGTALISGSITIVR